MGYGLWVRHRLMLMRAVTLFQNQSELKINVKKLKLKNGHILPAGQWYTPSVIINNALTMQ